MKKKIGAFSIAEAFIMLLVVSVAIGLSAPMVTKQIKHNNLSNVQTNKLGREIDSAKTQSRINREDINDLQAQINGTANDLESLIASKVDTDTVSALEERIEELERQLEERVVPSGTIAFFNGNCPTGWSNVNANWNGRFPRFAGNYNVCNVRGENTNGGCVDGVASTVTNNVGKFGGDTIRNVIGAFTNDTRSGSNESGPFSVTSSWGWGFKGGSAGSATYNMEMNLSRSVPTGVEVQPKSITLRGCIKN